MKAIASGKFLLAALFLGACSSASKLSYDTLPAGARTIADLKSRCTGNSHLITEDITVTGTVTGNDLYGEFPKALIIEDASGGIEIAIDRRDLADDYPFGTVVSVSCNGLALGDYGGKIQLGAPPTGDYSVDRIPAQEVARFIRKAAPAAAAIEPVTRTFDRINLRHADTFVRFDGVRFAETGAWCDADETGALRTTERTLIDNRGRRFIVRTAPTCLYAKEPVPQGTGSVSGIIDYFDGTFSLRITHRRILFSTVAGHPTADPSVAGY